MSEESDELLFTCEICGIRVVSGERTVRISSETCISDGFGGGYQGENDCEIVLSVFHAECVSGTMQSRECDVINYIAEAREVVSIEIPEKAVTERNILLYRGESN